MVDFDLDLSFLTIEERQTILAVLKRDEELRQAEQNRKKALKNEISQLRQQSAIRVDSEQKRRQCARCHKELGLIFNKGELCARCKHRVCPNCRVTCSESSAFSWLCSLCYKQRLLPAVAGDWFYEKLDEKYKHDMSSAYGSAVVRSSIRRSTAPFSNGVSPQESGTRSNPFTESTASSEKSSTEALNVSPHHTVRKVTNRQRDSSGSSSDEDTVSRSSAHASTLPGVSGQPGEAGIKVDEIPADDEESLPPAARELRGSNSSSELVLPTEVVSSHERLTSEKSVESADLLTSADQRHSSTSETGSAQPDSTLAADSSDFTVEQLTQIKFRRCSVLAPNDQPSAKLDPDVHAAAGSQSAPCNVSGSCRLSIGAPSSVASLSNNSLDQVDNSSLNSELSFDSLANPSLNGTHDDLVSPSMRRRIPLTPELDRKSPMIGRRSIDISEKFLKDFSDSSEESDVSLDEELLEPEDVPLQSSVAPARYNPSPRLSVIREVSVEDLSVTPAKLEERKALKLVIRPDTVDTQLITPMEGDTPITPEKYKKNWDSFTRYSQPEVSAAGSMSMWNSDMSLKEALEGALQDASSAEELNFSAVNETDETDHRLSPDGCSGKGDTQTSEPYSNVVKQVPSLSVTDDTDSTTYATIDPDHEEVPAMTSHPVMSHSATSTLDKKGRSVTPTSDVFEEQDIDNIFRQAKKDTLSPRMGSHLSISTDSLHSSFTEADYYKHEIAGEIQFSLGYEKKTGVLTITVNQCRGLTAVNKKKNTSDPLLNVTVKCYLVSGTQKVSKRKTKVMKSSLNPEFNETFRYTLSETQLLFRTLQISVWSVHRMGTNDFLGEVNITLDSFIFHEDGEEAKWYPLGNKILKVPESPRMQLPTELSVALRCVPSKKATKTEKAKKAEVEVKVLTAKNLPYKKQGTRDSFVKCVLLPDKQKHKTQIIKDSLNPYWGDMFTFTKKTTEDLDECALELTIWDHDRLGNHDLLGALRFSKGTGTSYKKNVEWMDASGRQKEFWERMLADPYKWVEQSFVIRKHVATDFPDLKEVVRKLHNIDAE